MRIGNSEIMIRRISAVSGIRWPGNEEQATLMDIRITIRDSSKTREEKIEEIVHSLRSHEFSFPGYCSENIREDCNLYGGERCPYREAMREYREFMGEHFDIADATNIAECKISDEVLRKTAIAILDRLESKPISAILFNKLCSLKQKILS